MNVKFSFDRVAVDRRGFTLEDVYRTIKNLFAAHGFPCISDCLLYTSPSPRDTR